MSRRSYLLIIGERQALAWIIREARMAFPPTRRAEVERLAVGDELFLVTTRACFHNPRRDATRIIGRADVVSEVVPLREPVEIAGRQFTTGCRLQLDSLAPYLEGVELVPLIPDLDCLRDSPMWGMRLRRPLLELSPKDRQLVSGQLRRVSSRATDLAPEYITQIQPVAEQGRRERGHAAENQRPGER